MTTTRLYHDEWGGALVEFTAVLPLLILLTFGVVQAGLILWIKVGLQHGVEMAARCASVSDTAIKHGGLDPSVTPTPCYSLNVPNAKTNESTVKSYAASNSWGVNPPASAFNVNPATPPCSGNLVIASYPYNLINYVFNTYSVTLTAQSCYPTS